MRLRHALLAAFAWLGACAGSFGPAGEKDAVRMILPDGDGVKYWPRWRGPSGQGVVRNGDFPDTWSATENVLWRVPLPGAGNSSPIIWQDRIFLTTAYDKGQR